MPGTVMEEIENAIPRLLDLAKELTWNKISNNHTFILSEIKYSDKNAFEQRRLTNRENGRKTPVPLHELTPALLQLYDDVYDINLYIYKATRKQTVIDIRYYRKSSLDEHYRAKVIGNKPMMHCKISIPPLAFRQ